MFDDTPADREPFDKDDYDAWEKKQVYKAILKVQGKTVGEVEVSFPFPYKLDATIDGAPKSFWYTGDTNGDGQPFYSDVEERVQW